MPHRIQPTKVGPLTFQLEVEFLDRLTEPVRDKKAESVSAIIRTALERYDFTNMVVVRSAQVLISVRLPVEIRRSLKKTARTKHTSVGQLVRTAVEAYLPQLEAEVAAPAKSDADPRSLRARRRKAKAAAHKADQGAKTAPRIMTKKRKG